MFNLFLDLRNINQNDEQTQIFICFIRVQLMALDIGIWAEVFFGSIRYARFVSIPVWKSIRFSGTTLARYPDFDTLLDPWLTYYIHTSTYRSTLHSTCVLVVVYKPYAHMYLCTVQCTTYYILSTARLLVLQRARQQSLQSLVSSLSVLYSLQYGTLYPTVCPISWIEHRTDLEGSSIRYSLRVSQRESSLSTLRTVPEKREAYRRYSYLDTNPSLTTVQSSVF